MRAARILGLDVSLTATGHADRNRSGVLTPPASVNRGVPRLRWIRDAVLDLADGCRLVVLEGYSFASRGRAIVSLGELGGVVRLALSDAGVPVVEIPPACRCKYATGKGNAPKEAVLTAAVRRLCYTGHSNDEADALWLLEMALDWYGERALDGPPPVPQSHRLALKAIEWPTLAVLEAA